MRKIAGLLLSVALLVSVGVSLAHAETVTYSTEEYRLADTPSKYGFKGLYELFSPDTAQKGKFGIGVFGEMSRFCLPGDPRYPELLQVSLAGYYGITDRLEVGVSVPFNKLDIPAASTTGRWPEDEALSDVSESGLGNVSAGLRFNVLRSESFDVTPYVQAFLPTASDPEVGTGADNTRIRIGMSAGTLLGSTRLYTQVAYQYATDYDQDARNFSERGRYTQTRPRFDYFGTNPLFMEYGNAIVYGAGLAIPVVEDSFELFGEFLGYHSLDDEDYIPFSEDYNTAGNYEPLDVVQDQAIGTVGAQIGFGNGFALKAGWGGKLFAEEPMYESPHWRVFAGLTYNSPSAETVAMELKPVGPEAPRGPVGDANGAIQPPPGNGHFDCSQILNLMVNFEFDKSTLTPEAIATLQTIGRLMRVCSDYSLEVQGHTDWMGTENYNMGLGNRRARAVVYYLVYDEGIDPSRVVLKEKLDKTPPVIAGETYGESQPIASNETDAGRAQNRRAQFVKR